MKWKRRKENKTNRNTKKNKNKTKKKTYYKREKGKCRENQAFTS